ncbi:MULTISPECIES: T6SS immunity protein Tli4 family protein [Pseudomonas]|uniref:T6SS immunity protein Tli4 family protein n=1 Tax=Pseudomonas TaxID=286 RepID=UPI00249A3ADE|nr:MULTISPECIES: T6SS immunity protein Tli4 family protein [Pseudomonas]MEC6745504.1 T6SS immunity protein Tli4 family protein [Pseudomonas qingdaonensis]
MKSLHMSWMWLALLAAPLSALGEPDYQTPPGWRTECMGRVQFDVPKEIAWHLAGGYWQKPDFDPVRPTIAPGGQQIMYGEGVTPEQTYLVKIEVSPVTDRNVFDRLQLIHGPNRGSAQTRVVRAQIDALQAQIDAKKADDEDYSALLEQHRALDDTITRINWVSTELFVLNDMIREFSATGRPTVKLEAERAAYLEEQAKWPTDALFEQERFLDLGIADTFADWVPGEMTAHLWRNQRIYRFVFHAGSDAAGVPVSLERVEPRARALLAAFRTREQYEIPQQRGFCLPFGFIADDGAPHHSITLGFNPVGNPHLLHRLSMGREIRKDADFMPKLLEQVISRRFPTLVQTDMFGPLRVLVGALDGNLRGARYKAYDAYHKPVDYETFTLDGDAPPTGYQPGVGLTVLDDHSQPQLAFERTRVDMLQTLKSIRALPGGHRFAPQAD